MARYAGAEGDVVSVVEARDPVLPVVFDSPHSGTDFPDGFRSAVPREVLLKSADLFVDELYAVAPQKGAALLSAHFPRIYIDPNRPLDDLDPSLVAGEWQGGLQTTDRAASGIGLIWHLAPDESAIYADPLPVDEIQRRIDRYWCRYHAELSTLLERRRRQFGAVWHVNCHSMPGAGTNLMGDIGQPRGEFIIGDRDGTTCSIDFTMCIVDFLRDKGFDVWVNQLFRGAEIVRRYGDPASQCHSVQIEINRSLYMDEQACTKGHTFDRFRTEVIVPLIDTVCDFAASRVAGAVRPPVARPGRRRHRWGHTC